MRTVTGPNRRGRWIWGLSGVATAAALTVPTLRVIGHSAGSPAYAQRTEQATQVIHQPVTRLTVDSAGSAVWVRAASVSQVSVTATITYSGPEPKPPVPPVPPMPTAKSVSSAALANSGVSLPSLATESLSGGELSLGVSSACQDSGCSVAFDVTVPGDVTAAVTSEGGSVLVSGVPSANIVSDGGAVNAQGIRRGLIVSSNGGPVVADDVAGALNADTEGGPVQAGNMTGPDATVTTEGGPALIDFAAAPQAVTVRTGGGAARLDVPGGPYALTADSGGAPFTNGVATDPAASRSIEISTDGGPLVLQP